MTEQTDRRLRFQFDFCLVGWFLYRHKNSTVKRVVSYCVKKGETNVTEINLFVARRTETTNRSTTERSLCFIDACLLPNVSHKVWLASV